jgi:hypothetical protein
MFNIDPCPPDDRCPWDVVRAKQAEKVVAPRWQLVH